MVQKGAQDPVATDPLEPKPLTYAIQWHNDMIKK